MVAISGLKVLRDGSVFLEIKLARKIISSSHNDLSDSLCDSELPSSSGAIHLHNECFYILFPFNPPHDFGEYSQARAGITFWGQPLICVVKRGGGRCAVKDVQACYRF
jgi:hypothetical protein